MRHIAVLLLLSACPSISYAQTPIQKMFDRMVDVTENFEGPVRDVSFSVWGISKTLMINVKVEEFVEGQDLKAWANVVVLRVGALADTTARNPNFITVVVSADIWEVEDGTRRRYMADQQERARGIWGIGAEEIVWFDGEATDDWHSRLHAEVLEYFFLPFLREDYKRAMRNPEMAGYSEKAYINTMLSQLAPDIFAQVYNVYIPALNDFKYNFAYRERVYKNAVNTASTFIE